MSEGPESSAPAPRDIERPARNSSGDKACFGRKQRHVAGGDGAWLSTVTGRPRQRRSARENRPPRRPDASYADGPGCTRRAWATCQYVGGRTTRAENRHRHARWHERRDTGIYPCGQPRGATKGPLRYETGFVSFTSWSPILSRGPDDFLSCRRPDHGPTGRRLRPAGWWGILLRLLILHQHRPDDSAPRRLAPPYVLSSGPVVRRLWAGVISSVGGDLRRDVAEDYAGHVVEYPYYDYLLIRQFSFAPYLMNPLQDRDDPRAMRPGEETVSAPATRRLRRCLRSSPAGTLPLEVVS